MRMPASVTPALTSTKKRKLGCTTQSSPARMRRKRLRIYAQGRAKASGHSRCQDSPKMARRPSHTARKYTTHSTERTPARKLKDCDAIQFQRVETKQAEQIPRRA